MNEYLMEIRYLVDDLGDVDIDDEFELPLREPGLEYVLNIQLPGHEFGGRNTSSISIIKGDKTLSNRAMSNFECRLILEIVGSIKFSFEVYDSSVIQQHPYENYCVKIKRGTASMAFSWSDNDHITSDSELRTALMKLVYLIEDLQPIDYQAFGLVPPIKL
jgi:hypothetical protein